MEWYVTLADGNEWGRQAKHVHGIDALLTAMTDSVQRVAKECPNLHKLTFAISWNLGTGTSGRERKSQRKKYDAFLPDLATTSLDTHARAVRPGSVGGGAGCGYRDRQHPPRAG